MNKMLLKGLCIMFFVTSCNKTYNEKKTDISSNDSLSSNHISKQEEISKEPEIDKNQTSIKIFSEKNGEIFIDCNAIINTNKKQELFDIDRLEDAGIKDMYSIDEKLSDFFSKIIKKRYSKVFYHSSQSLIPCSAIIYFINQDETSSWYLFQFDDKGKFMSKLLLSEKNDEIPELVIKKYSEISVEDRLLKITLIKSMLDEYIDANNYSELVDSIVTNYDIENGKLNLKSRDSVRYKIEKEE